MAETSSSFFERFPRHICLWTINIFFKLLSQLRFVLYTTHLCSVIMIMRRLFWTCHRTLNTFFTSNNLLSIFLTPFINIFMLSRSSLVIEDIIGLYKALCRIKMTFWLNHWPSLVRFYLLHYSHALILFSILHLSEI